VKDALILTCEHGGSVVPVKYRGLFASRAAQTALRSHRGADLGALPLARLLARRLGAPLILSSVSRLLVELNRSPAHPRLYSEYSAALDESERRRLLAEYYHPHRERVVKAIGAGLRRYRRVVHVAVHSFTPLLAGSKRSADIGLLYDSRRESERGFCRRWKAAILALDATCRVQRNYPYRGRDDGLTTALRRVFDEPRYLGIELELNNALLTGAVDRRRRTSDLIVESLIAILRSP
jgi:predicted N-formylglutamate amidohydrolase